VGNLLWRTSMQDEHEQADEEQAPQDDEPFEALQGEREWFMSVGPEPGPGDSDGGGSD
jgi:hypothetical protein